MTDQTCSAQYERPGGRQHGDRIVECGLPYGHLGDHLEGETESTWPSPPTADVLVGWHQGRVMTIDEIGHHMKRIRQVEPEIKQAVITDRVLGGIVPDLLNEIDRLRFLLAERERAGEPEVLAAIADGRRCPRCGTTAVLGRYDVCRPCAVAEGWEPGEVKP